MFDKAIKAGALGTALVAAAAPAYADKAIITANAYYTNGGFDVETTDVANTQICLEVGKAPLRNDRVDEVALTCISSQTSEVKHYKCKREKGLPVCTPVKP